MLSQSIDQRRVAVRVVAIQIDVFSRRFEFGKRKIENAAQGEIVFYFRPFLGPLHVRRLSIHLAALSLMILRLRLLAQIKYAGTPSSMTPKLIALFKGNL